MVCWTLARNSSPSRRALENSLRSNGDKTSSVSIQLGYDGELSSPPTGRRVLAKVQQPSKTSSKRPDSGASRQPYQATLQHFTKSFSANASLGTRFTTCAPYAWLRVRCRTATPCSASFHNLWSSGAGRIKDFIARPRPNFYQSLHTSVITEDGTPF